MSKNILLLPGFTHNSTFFEPLKYKLEQDKNYNVIAMDFYGRAKAQKLNDPKDYNYQNYVEQVNGLLKQSNFDSFDVILGSSMGGLVAMMFLEKYPNSTQKLILNDIGTFIQKFALDKIGSFIKPQNYFARYDQARKHVEEEFEECNLSNLDFEYICENYIIECEEGYKLNYDYKISAAFWRKNKQKKLPDMDFSELWRSMLKSNHNLDITIFRGEKSQFLQTSAIAKMSKCNNVKNIVTFNNCGHLPMFINSYEIDQAIQYI